MRQPELLVRYRPTWRQVLGRSAGWSVLVAVLAVLLVVAAILVRPVREWWSFGWLFLGILWASFAGRVRRMGVDASRHGLASTGADKAELIPWERIIDIRTERHGSQTDAVVCLESGETRQLWAPFDGPGLGRDPDFEPKIFTLRNLWETYRNWTAP